MTDGDTNDANDKVRYLKQDGRPSYTPEDWDTDPDAPTTTEGLWTPERRPFLTVWNVVGGFTVAAVLIFYLLVFYP